MTPPPPKPPALKNVRPKPTTYTIEVKGDDGEWRTWNSGKSKAAAERIKRDLYLTAFASNFGVRDVRVVEDRHEPKREHVTPEPPRPVSFEPQTPEARARAAQAMEATLRDAWRPLFDRK